MRLTVAQLRKIIKEEVSRMLVEGDEPMFEARGETAKNREASLKKQIQKLQKELEASMDKKRQTREDEDEQERLESELDKLEKELLVVRDPSMKESRRRNGTINEITLPEMYDELIGGIEDALSNPDSQAKVLAGLRRMMGVKVSDEQLAREEEDRKKMKASGKKYNI